MENSQAPLESQEMSSGEETLLENVSQYPGDEEHFDNGDYMKVAQLFLYNLPLVCFPLFEISHYLITALSLRLEFGSRLSRQSPLASSTSMVISCLAGSLMSSLVLGSPLASVLKNDWTILTILSVWASLHFSPKDIVYNVVRQQHVYTVLWCIKEVDRMRKIAVGVSLVGEVYPGSVILRVVVGVMRGNGTTIIRPLVRLICGEYKPDNELLAPGRSTQLCVLAALAWTLTLDSSLSSSVYTMAVFIFISFRLDNILSLSGPEKKGFTSVTEDSPVLQTDSEIQSDKKDA